jgi:hypothetical protein
MGILTYVVLFEGGSVYFSFFSEQHELDGSTSSSYSFQVKKRLVKIDKTLFFETYLNSNAKIP